MSAGSRPNSSTCFSFSTPATLFSSMFTDLLHVGLLELTPLLLQAIVLVVPHEVDVLISKLVDRGLPFFMFSSSCAHHLLDMLLVVLHISLSIPPMVAKVLQD
eukprot:56490-Heterocapsa_arctica.AAC.1